MSVRKRGILRLCLAAIVIGILLISGAASAGKFDKFGRKVERIERKIGKFTKKVERYIPVVGEAMSIGRDLTQMNRTGQQFHRRSKYEEQLGQKQAQAVSQIAEKKRTNISPREYIRRKEQAIIIEKYRGESAKEIRRIGRRVGKQYAGRLLVKVMTLGVARKANLGSLVKQVNEGIDKSKEAMQLVQQGFNRVPEKLKDLSKRAQERVWKRTVDAVKPFAGQLTKMKERRDAMREWKKQMEKDGVRLPRNFEKAFKKTDKMMTRALDKGGEAVYDVVDTSMRVQADIATAEKEVTGAFKKFQKDFNASCNEAGEQMGAMQKKFGDLYKQMSSWKRPDVPVYSKSKIEDMIDKNPKIKEAREQYERLLLGQGGRLQPTSGFDKAEEIRSKVDKLRQKQLAEQYAQAGGPEPPEDSTDVRDAYDSLSKKRARLLASGDAQRLERLKKRLEEEAYGRQKGVSERKKLIKELEELGEKVEHGMNTKKLRQALKDAKKRAKQKNEKQKNEKSKIKKPEPECTSSPQCVEIKGEEGWECIDGKCVEVKPKAKEPKEEKERLKIVAAYMGSGLLKFIGKAEWGVVLINPPKAEFPVQTQLKLTFYEGGMVLCTMVPRGVECNYVNENVECKKDPSEGGEWGMRQRQGILVFKNYFSGTYNEKTATITIELKETNNIPDGGTLTQELSGKIALSRIK